MLTNREKKQFLVFEKRLSMPKWKFILVYGVLAWGLTVAVLITGYEMWVQKKSLKELLDQELWIRVVLFPLAGIAYGWWMWKFISRQYKKLSQKELMP